MTRALKVFLSSIYEYLKNIFSKLFKSRRHDGKKRLSSTKVWRQIERRGKMDDISINAFVNYINEYRRFFIRYINNKSELSNVQVDANLLTAKESICLMEDSKREELLREMAVKNWNSMNLMERKPFIDLASKKKMWLKRNGAYQSRCQKHKTESDNCRNANLRSNENNRSELKDDTTDHCSQVGAEDMDLDSSNQPIISLDVSSTANNTDNTEHQNKQKTKAGHNRRARSRSEDSNIDTEDNLTAHSSQHENGTAVNKAEHQNKQKTKAGHNRRARSRSEDSNIDTEDNLIGHSSQHENGTAVNNAEHQNKQKTKAGHKRRPNSKQACRKNGNKSEEESAVQTQQLLSSHAIPSISSKVKTNRKKSKKGVAQNKMITPKR